MDWLDQKKWKSRLKSRLANPKFSDRLDGPLVGQRPWAEVIETGMLLITVKESKKCQYFIYIYMIRNEKNCIHDICGIQLRYNTTMWSIADGPSEESNQDCTSTDTILYVIMPNPIAHLLPRRVGSSPWRQEFTPRTWCFIYGVCRPDLHLLLFYRLLVIHHIPMVRLSHLWEPQVTAGLFIGTATRWQWCILYSKYIIVLQIS